MMCGGRPRQRQLAKRLALVEPVEGWPGYRHRTGRGLLATVGVTLFWSASLLGVN
jgi:hypothetical protein